MHIALLKGVFWTVPCSTSMDVARANMASTSPRHGEKREGDRGCDLSDPVLSMSRNNHVVLPQSVVPVRI